MHRSFNSKFEINFEITKEFNFIKKIKIFFLRFLGQGLLTESCNEAAKNRRAIFQEFFQKQ